MSAPPSALVTLIRIIGLGAAAIGWLLGVTVFVLAFPLMPMLASAMALLLWTISILLTPAFAFFAIRRFKDTSWNGIVDPVMAGGLGIYCGLVALAVLQRTSSLSLA